MSIEDFTQKKITQDWQAAFPELNLFSQRKLYKRVGPLLIGIELTKLPHAEAYRPHFVIYGLFEKDIKACLSRPILLKEYENNKGLQFSIPYQNHNILFNEVVENVRIQTPVSFKGNVSLARILSVLEEYSKASPLSFAPASYIQAMLQESMLEIALYIDKDKYQKMFERIRMVNWDEKHFQTWQVSIAEWFQKLNNKIEDRKALLTVIETNKRDKKINGLNASELIV